LDYIYNFVMATTSKRERRGPWTAAEIAREESAGRARAKRDLEKTPQERLEETVRLSRFMSELRQGVSGDVRAR
jgi:hypothetical protein